MQTSNSSQYNLVKNNYISGGIIVVTFGNWINLISTNYNYSDSKEWWYTFKIKANRKGILVIAICRPPEGSNHGICTMKNQLDQADKKISSIQHHCRDIFKEISSCIKNQTNVNNIVLVGDMN